MLAATTTTTLPSGSEILVAILAGVLLPVILTRPAILEPNTWPWRDRERSRRFFEAMMTLFAFFAAAYVFTALFLVLRGHVPNDISKLVAAGAFLLAGYGLAVHITPLFRPPRLSSWGVYVFLVVALVSSVILANVYATNALHPVTYVLPTHLADWGITAVACLALASASLYAYPYPSDAIGPADTALPRPFPTLPANSVQPNRRPNRRWETTGAIAFILAALAVGRRQRRAAGR